MQTAALTQLCVKEYKHHTRLADEWAWSHADDQDGAPRRTASRPSYRSSVETVAPHAEHGIVRRLLAGLRTRARPVSVE